MNHDRLLRPPVDAPAAPLAQLIAVVPGARRRRAGRPARLVVAFVTLGATALLAACSRPAAAPEPVRAVRTVTVGTAALASSTDYAGEVKARVETRLAFRVPGKLVRRHVELGEVLRPGQLLAQIDPQDLKLAQDAAQAALLAAQTSRDQAQADLQRTRDLQAQGFLSGAELERRENALKAAEATLAQARAQASAQGNQAAYAELRADTGGVVTGVDAEPGTVLAAGTPVLRVAQDGPRDVAFQVPEQQVKAMRALLGRPQALAVTLWGSEAASPATLRELAAAADPVTRTFLAKAEVGRAEVRLGQTALVRVAAPGNTSAAAAAAAPAASKLGGKAGATAAAAPQAIKLPLEAVGDQGGQPVVWLLDGSSLSVKPQPVQLGAYEGRQAVVLGGLSPGQEVVVAGVHTLTPGQKVKRYAEPARSARATPVGEAPLTTAAR